MSEGRALTNFTGNAVATVLIGTWIKEIDNAQVRRVLAGEDPFDETTSRVDHDGMSRRRTPSAHRGSKRRPWPKRPRSSSAPRAREEALTR